MDQLWERERVRLEEGSGLRLHGLLWGGWRCAWVCEGGAVGCGLVGEGLEEVLKKGFFLLVLDFGF